MGLVVRAHSYADGVPARPDHLNTNETVLYTVINGNLDWDNITAALVNAANGFLKLDSNGLVPAAQLPAVATTTAIAEVTAARGSMADLDERLDVALGEDGTLTEVVAARGSKADLDERLDVALGEDGTIGEVVTARGSKANLDARLDISLADNGNIKVGEICWVLQGDAYVQAGLGYCLVGVELAKKSISKVKIYASTAPTGASLIVDVNKNGTTIFTSQAKRPEIAISGNSDDSDTPDVTALSEGDRLSFDVDQVGSTVAGGAPLLISVVLT